MTTDMDNRWIWKAEAAAYLGMKPNTLLKAFQTGRCKAAMSGDRWYTTREWLDAFRSSGDMYRKPGPKARS